MNCEGRVLYRCFFYFALSTSWVLGHEVIDPLLLEKIKKGELCSSSQDAPLCYNMPYHFKGDEGIYSEGQTAHIFIESPLKSVAFKNENLASVLALDVFKERAFQISALGLFADEKFIIALENLPIVKFVFYFFEIESAGTGRVKAVVSLHKNSLSFLGVSQVQELIKIDLLEKFDLGEFDRKTKSMLMFEKK